MPRQWSYPEFPSPRAAAACGSQPWEEQAMRGERRFHLCLGSHSVFP